MDRNHSKGRILVVDDSTVIRKQVKLVLEQVGHIVITATDGSDALELLSNSDLHIDLIVSDINMPKMDGITFMQHVKATKQFKNIPFLVISSKNDDEKLDSEIFEKGANEFLSKPICVFKLRTRAQNLIDLHVMHKNLEEKARNIEKELEARKIELIESEKLAAVGLLGAGVAHQIRNPLTIIMGNLEILEAMSGNGEVSAKDLEKRINIISKAGARISGIVRKLESLCYETSMEVGEIDSADEIFEHVNEMMKPTLDLSRVRVRIIKSAYDQPFMGNKKALIESFMYLVKNSIEAYMDLSSGRREIILSSERIDNNFILKIEDNAGGIPEKIADTIFKPFESTKDKNVKMGLGLSMARRILTKSGCAIIFEHKDGGAIFKVITPLVKKAG